MYTNQGSKQVSEGKFNGGPWNQEECLKYLVFLDQNKIVMASRQKKKRFRVFDQLSCFVETRSSLQCRSHHQKAIEKYKQVKEIILHEKQLVSLKTYRLKLKELKQKAKVKEEFESVEKPIILKQKMSIQQKKKDATQVDIPLSSMHIMPSYFNQIPSYPYQMLPMYSNEMMTNYLFYTFSFQN